MKEALVPLPFLYLMLCLFGRRKGQKSHEVLLLTFQLTAVYLKLAAPEQAYPVLKCSPVWVLDTWQLKAYLLLFTSLV